MKLITTIYDKRRMNDFLNYADGIVLGSDIFSCRLNKSFSVSEINDFIHDLTLRGKEIFLLVNPLVTDCEMEIIKASLADVLVTLVTGIIVSDLGFIKMFAEMGYLNKIIYNPNTLLTNSFDFNYYSDSGIKGAFLSEELTKDEIVYILKHKKYQTFMTGLGYLNMFTSRRKLIKNFEEESHEKLNSKVVQIKEEFRLDEIYQVKEDVFGTHVHRDKIFECFDELDEFVDLDYLFLDSQFLDDDITLDTLKLYKGKLKLKDYQTKYPNHKFDKGFLYKKLVYIKESND